MTDEPSKTYAVRPAAGKGMGPGSAGQSGDTQGLSDIAEAGSESVQELVEEGQYFEAEVLQGVEAADAVDAEEVPAEDELADAELADDEFENGEVAADELDDEDVPNDSLKRKPPRK